MPHWLPALALLAFAGQDPVPPTPLPTAWNVAYAYSNSDAAGGPVCDENGECDQAMYGTPGAAMKHLRCHKAGKDKARCTFTAYRKECRANFVVKRSAGEAAWWPAEGVGGDPRRVQAWCRG